jgi:capsular polysaccharide biosynthesis protein
MTFIQNPLSRAPDDLMAEGEKGAGREIDLMELFFRLLESWKYILAAALIGAVLAGVYTLEFITPVYEATAKLYVMNSGDSAINLADLQIGSYLASDYQEVFKTWEVHEMVLSDLHLDYSYQHMQSMLSVSNPADTRILYITVSSSDPREAMDIANEYATVAKKYISKTMATEEPNVLSSALMPTRPVKPNKTMNVMIGLLAGALLAVGVIMIRFVTDDKLKTVDDVRNYADLPTLALVPLKDQASGKRNHAKGKKKGK